MILRLLTAVCLCAVVPGCTKEPARPTAPSAELRNRIISCFGPVRSDSVEIVQALQGTWMHDWTEELDEDANQYYHRNAVPGTRWEFAPDGSLTRLDSITPTTVGNWRLKRDGGGFGLILEPGTYYFQSFAICGDSMILDYKGEASFQLWHRAP